MKRYGVPFLGFLVSGCVSAYEGRLPDLSKIGTEAQIELQRFEMSESVWGQSPGIVRMGERRDAYWLRTVEPVITKVSPRAAKKLEQVKPWNAAGQTVLALGIAYFFAASADLDQRRAVGYSMFGASFGLWLYATHRLTEAEAVYNHDLRSRLSPQAGMTIEF